MIDLNNLLLSLGLGVASNGIYSAIEKALSQGMNRGELEESIQDALFVAGQDITASSIVNVLVSSGAIEFSDSSIFAPNRICFTTQDGTTAIFGGNFSSATSSTAIKSKGRTGVIRMDGNAKIEHGDGSVTFYVGKAGEIKFYT